MWATIASWFFGGGLSALGKLGLDFYKTKLDAENTVERQTVDLAKATFTLQAKESEFESKLLIAEQGNWFTRWVRPAWAFPFVAFSWKVVIWDNMLQDLTHGNTDALHPQMWNLMMVVAGAYFGGRSLETVARIFNIRQGVTGKGGP